MGRLASLAPPSIHRYSLLVRKHGARNEDRVGGPEPHAAQAEPRGHRVCCDPAQGDAPLLRGRRQRARRRHVELIGEHVDPLQRLVLRELYVFTSSTASCARL